MLAHMVASQKMPVEQLGSNVALDLAEQIIDESQKMSKANLMQGLKEVTDCKKISKNIKKNGQ